MIVIRKKKNARGKIIIDLTGPEGNAFALIGVARRLAKTLEKDADAISKEMMSGNYENVIAVLEREFGDYVILER